MNNKVKRHYTDVEHKYYQFGGEVLHSKWKFPNGAIREPKRIRSGSERIEGKRMPTLTIEFDRGSNLPVKAFYNRIFYMEDVEPDCNIAYQIHDKYE